MINAIIDFIADLLYEFMPERARIGCAALGLIIVLLLILVYALK